MNLASDHTENRWVQFRFYEELNDFLPLAQQRQTFSRELAGSPSVKNAIEAIGVPHTEVDLILVNGDSVDFGYQLHGGERIAVYPIFERFDISPINRLRPKSLRITRFILDATLGTLARDLRLLGFDTVYENDLDDATIVRIAKKEKRIIVTRDTDILKYGEVTHGYRVRSTEPRMQVFEVVNKLQLQNSFNPLTRCANCNGLLRSVEKALLAKRIMRRCNTFSECPDCRKLHRQMLLSHAK